MEAVSQGAASILLVDGQLLESLTAKVEELERLMSDVQQRLDTLQTPLWKRIWFRVLGWPGQTNLNAERPSWRPWQRDRWPRRGGA